jgi:TonB family protein
MKKTLTYSLLLHGMLLSAFLILTGGRATMLHEKTFLVNLAEDVKGQVSRGLNFRKREEGPDKHMGKDRIVVPAPVNKTVQRANHDPISEKLPMVAARPLGPEGSDKGAEKVHAVAAESDVEEAGESRGVPALNEGAEESAAGKTAEGMPTHALHTSLSGARHEGLGDKGAGMVPSRIIELIGSAIESKKTYPPLARRRGLEGTVRIGFSINPEGKPWDIEVIESSGHKVLDAATLTVVKRAAPFPYTDRRIEVPVSYRLRD